MLSTFLIAQEILYGHILERGVVLKCFVTSFSEFAHAAVSTTIRSNIDQLVWESHHNCVVLSRMFHRRRGASFIPCASFFNLDAICGG